MIDDEHHGQVYASKGVTAIVEGERGTVASVTYKGDAVGAFVRLDSRPAMLYVTFKPIAPTSPEYFDRQRWRDVSSVREVDREEFDELTGLAEARRSMGWDLPARPRSINTSTEGGD